VHVEQHTTFLYPITDHGSDFTVIMAPTMGAIMSFKVDTRQRSRRRTSR
jgi:hypothetical protein